MSGGYFDRSIYAIGEMAATIERDIARAIQPNRREHMRTHSFVIGIVSQKLTTSCNHHALKHNFHKVVKTIFFLSMLAY